jgi:hypothetical protein
MLSLRSGHRLGALVVLALSLAAVLAVLASAAAAGSGRAGSAPRLAPVVHSAAASDAVGGGGVHDEGGR